MWHLNKISLQNFISHKHTSYSFDNNKTYLIIGENLDDDGQEGNGSGKSAIIEAIIFALTGDSFRKIKSNELIKNDEQECIVELDLYNTLLGAKMNITRGLKQRGSSYVKIEYNNENKVLATVSEYDKFIIEQLDIPKEDLLNYFIISAEKYQSFLLSGDTKKKEIISRFSNINLLNKSFEKIDCEIKAINETLNAKQFEKSKNLGKKELLNEQNVNVITEDEFYNQIRDKTNELEQQICNLRNNNEQDIITIDSKKELLRTKINELEETNKIIDENKIKINEINSTILEIEMLENETKQGLQKLLKEKTDIEKQLLDVVECPKCTHNFSFKDSILDIDKLRLKLTNIKDNETNINNDIKLIQESFLEFNQKLKVIKNHNVSIISKSNTIEDDITLLRRQITKISDDIKFNEQKIYNLQQKINELNDSEFVSPNTINTELKLKELDLLIESIDKEIISLDTTLIQKNEWVNIFNKFKTHLANKSIKGIQSKINLYLEKIKSNLSVNIEGYKLLSDNRTIRENISINVLRDGLDEGSFGKFSGGEKVRIDICCILALQNLINQNSKTGGLNLLILDEIIEKVDSLGVSEILKQLNELQQTILAITHSNQQRNFENIIKVVKQNKESKIKI